MMKRIFSVFVMLCLFTSLAFALQGKTATDEDIANLKRDILSGKIAVGKMRLKDFRRVYGEAKNINITDRRIVYDFGDLRVEFDKQRLWKKWEYDSFKQQAYTDKVNDLRYDLESKKLVGENITASKIIKDYGEPTESMETSEDGEITIYYYGDIKLTFENNFILDNFKGKNLESASAAQAGSKTASEKSAATSASQLK